LCPQTKTTITVAVMKKAINNRLPNCVWRAGNISFDKLSKPPKKVVTSKIDEYAS
jgi:hypothetical protein